MLALLIALLFCCPAFAGETLQAGAAYDDTNCDWYVWDKPHPWGWATVYSNDGKTCRGKYWVNPSPRQYLEALKRGEGVIAPANPHPTNPVEIAKVGGLKPLPPRQNRLSVSEVAEIEDK